MRATLAALACVWAAALLLSGVGFLATYSLWPPLGDWLLASPALALMALPNALLDVLGLPYHGQSVYLGMAFILFWAAMGGLHLAALLTGRRVYVVLAALLLAPAAWKWTVHASGLMGI